MKRFLTLLLTLALCAGLSVPALAAGFTDVPETHTFHDAIMDCAAKGITSGYAGGTFRPAASVTRAQFCVMLSRAFYPEAVQENSTEANKALGWFVPNTEALAQAGVLKGTSFASQDRYQDAGAMDRPISRYDMAQLMTNIMAQKGSSASEEEKAAAAEKIADWPDVHDGYRDAVANVYALGIIGGYSDGTFSGTVTMNRGQGCVVIYRMAQYVSDGDKDGEQKPEAPAEAPAEETPGKTPSETPAEKAPDKAPAETPAEKAPDKTPSETPAEKTPDKTPTETPAEKTPDKTPAETPAEKAPDKAPTETPAPSGNDLQAMRQGVLDLVNAARAENGKSPLTLDDALCGVAQLRAEEIVQSFSHTRPNGTTCFTAIDEAGISYRALGENIAAGQSSPASVMNSWMNSEGHRKNILSGDFSSIGIGYVNAPSGYGHYWVQMFMG